MQCVDDCNKCLEKNSLWNCAYLIIACLERKDENIIKLVNKICPNLSVCPICRVDDFVHVEGCVMDKEILKKRFKNERKNNRNHKR